MPRLEVTAFVPALLPLVADFDCGSLDYQQEVADWIRGQKPRTVLHALGSHTRPTRVWLYSTPEDGIIGYGSLCPSNWSTVPGGRRDMPIVLIPNVGIKTAFQGHPMGVSPDERYSTQIMEHLKREAGNFQRQEGFLPLLGLFVHPNNIAGQKLYRRVGFVDYEQTFHDEETDVTYQGMILKLTVPESDPQSHDVEEATMVTRQEVNSSPDSPATTQRTFDEAVEAVLQSPPTPDQRAKKDAAKSRREERKRHNEQQSER